MPKTQTKRVVKTKRVTPTKRITPTKRTTQKSQAKQDYEKRLIRNRLKKQGIDPKVVDVDALYDPRLSYKENVNNLGLSGKARFTSRERFDFKKKRIQSIHDD
ncbi:MAG: hypothetical protein ACFFC7_24710 [Candidatus Hermodarchaeota archaeon]